MSDTTKTEVYDSSGSDVFEDAVVMNVDVELSTEYSRYVSEDGTAISDNQVNKQAKIEIEVIACNENHNEIFQKIDDARKKGSAFTVVTRARNYSSMYITNITHKESAEVVGAIRFIVTFVKQIFASSVHSTLDPVEPKDNKTKSSGTKKPQQATESQTSWICKGTGGAGCR